MSLNRTLVLTFGLALAMPAYAPHVRAQDKPAPAAPSKPPAAAPEAAAKPAPEAPVTLRIRGQVESVDAGGVVVQMSTGISLRVDLDAETPILSAARIKIADVKRGADLRIRTRTATGGTTVASDVLVVEAPKVPGPDLELSGLSLRGELKGIEKSEDGQVLVLSEKGGDRRLPLSRETSFWRIDRAQIGDIKSGVSLSVVIVREPGGSAKPERAVFGTTPAGALLPL